MSDLNRKHIIYAILLESSTLSAVQNNERINFKYSTEYKRLYFGLTKNFEKRMQNHFQKTNNINYKPRHLERKVFAMGI